MINALYVLALVSSATTVLLALYNVVINNNSSSKTTLVLFSILSALWANKVVVNDNPVTTVLIWIVLGVILFTDLKEFLNSRNSRIRSSKG